MAKITIALTSKAAERLKLKADKENPKGIFIWVGAFNCVDWIVGWHKERGFEATRHYGDWSFWKALKESVFCKDGFITITRFL